MSPEFDLIAKYFARPVKHARLGVGDDCALIGVSPDCELAISTDTLVSGTHFFADADADAEKLGHKALAVNISDLAAMGALPRYVTLALTLPLREILPQVPPPPADVRSESKPKQPAPVAGGSD